MHIVTSPPKKLCISFYFLLAFGQQQLSSVSILVVVLFQALAARTR